MKIRFCENNKGKGKVIRRLKEEFPDLDIKIKDCIKSAARAAKKPMAKVDKVMITARDGSMLYKKIVEVIKTK